LHSDILIIGAGPAGASAALFLAKRGIRSTVVDKHSFPRDKVCGDALSGKVVEVLNKLDPTLVQRMESDADFLGSYGVTFVAPNSQSLRVPFATNTSNRKHAPGYITTRVKFDNFLVDELRASSYIDFREGVELRNFTRDGDLFTAKCNKTGTTYTAKLVLSADGAYSDFAKHIGGLVTEPDHNCFGLRAYYKGVEGLDKENFIELHFLPEILPGYLWIFPMANGMANVGVGMRADKMQKRKINLKKQFEFLLENNPSIKQRFSNAEKVGDVKLWGLPLGSKQRKISGAGYMLLGDAAQLIDPFTGEGIGNALMCGMLAANQATVCLESGNYSEVFMQQYDNAVYGRLGSELTLSYKMQQLVNFPWLFNLVVRKANSSPLLSKTISCMFEDLDMRAQLRNPLFYLRILFS